MISHKIFLGVAIIWLALCSLTKETLARLRVVQSRQLAAATIADIDNEIDVLTKSLGDAIQDIVTLNIPGSAIDTFLIQQTLVEQYQTTLYNLLDRYQQTGDTQLLAQITANEASLNAQLAVLQVVNTTIQAVIRELPGKIIRVSVVKDELDIYRNQQTKAINDKAAAAIAAAVIATTGAAGVVGAGVTGSGSGAGAAGTGAVGAAGGASISTAGDGAASTAGDGAASAAGDEAANDALQPLVERIEELTEELNTVETSIQSLDESIESMNNQVESITNTLQGFQQSAAEVNESLETATIPEHQQALLNLQSQMQQGIVDSEQALTGAQNSITQLTQDRVALVAERDALQAELDAVVPEE